jgi:copper chaperone CopZ
VIATKHLAVSNIKSIPVNSGILFYICLIPTNKSFMKNRILTLIIGLFTLGGLAAFTSACSSKAEGGKEVSFKVYGNCNMCKKTIEGSLENEKGILSAEWNKDTKMMSVSYDTTKTDETKIHHQIATAGYDTEVEKGNDEAYKKLHECCQYERKK